MKKLSILFSALLAATMSFAGTKTDTLTSKTIGSPSVYSEFKGITVNSDAVYAGQATTGTSTNAGAIQMRSDNSNSGIVSTTSGGTIKSVTITVKSGNKTINVYGSNTAYTAATDLYKSASQGTLVGSLSATGTVTITGDYAYVGVRSARGAIYLTDISFEWEIMEGAISKPTFTPADADFADTTTVTLAAEEGLDIYYTLDGTEPTDSTGTKYAAAIALNKTTTIKAIAYNATTKKSSAVAEKTYTCYSLITTCADLVKAANNDFVELGKVTVAYVNGGSTYICDKTGYGLIFKYNFGLKAGQEAEGIKGRVSIYNGLPEVVPSVDTAALTITEGKVPEPAELTVVPTTADLNKYVHITGVATPDSTWKSSDKSTEARTLKVAWGKDSLTLYNTFKIDQSFEAGYYNIVGFVTCYNTTIQIAVVSATAAVYSVVADVNNDDMGTIEGLPAEKIAYGTEITLTAKPNTGYEFESWTDTTGVVVCTTAAYTFMVTGDVNIQANFAIKTFKVDADVNDEKMGTVDGVPADEVAYGTEVTFTALPADGYKFVNWTDAAGAEVSTEAVYTFTVTAEVTYTANFALSTAIDNTTAEKTAVKRIENGTLIIEKNGVRYNALGTVVE